MSNQTNRQIKDLEEEQNRMTTSHRDEFKRLVELNLQGERLEDADVDLLDRLHDKYC